MKRLTATMVLSLVLFSTAFVAGKGSPTALEFPDSPVVPNEMKEIISGLLKKNPDERLTADQLCENQWLKEMEFEHQKLYDAMPFNDEKVGHHRSH